LLPLLSVHFHSQRSDSEGGAAELSALRGWRNRFPRERHVFTEEERRVSEKKTQPEGKGER